MYNSRKVAIITGGGSGIGRETALTLSKSNIITVIVDIDLENANKTALHITKKGRDAKVIQCDMSNVSSIEKMVNLVIEEFGRIDILVNSAGIGINVPIEDISEEQWDKVIDINLKSVFFCSKFVFEEMKKRNYGGRIINLASIAGERGGRFAGAHYSASKGGILALTKCFALRGAEYNITVNALAPGTIDTNMTKSLGNTVDDIPLGRKGNPKEVADLIAFLTSKKASYITGTTIDINGGQFMR